MEASMDIHSVTFAPTEPNECGELELAKISAQVQEYPAEISRAFTVLYITAGAITFKLYLRADETAQARRVAAAINGAPLAQGELE